MSGGGKTSFLDFFFGDAFNSSTASSSSSAAFARFFPFFPPFAPVAGSAYFTASWSKKLSMFLRFFRIKACRADVSSSSASACCCLPLPLPLPFGFRAPGFPLP